MIDVNNPTATLNGTLELMFHAQRAFTAQPDAMLSEFGWNRVHHRILYFVARQPGLTVGELLTILGVSKQALHAPLRALTERGMVEVAISTHDRRARCLTLTAAGSALEDALTTPQRALMAQVFKLAGPDATAAWSEVMRAIAATTQNATS
ncbi:MarR family winged helix-turn-helix transcriptional regulator [Chitinibacteraceae bacterium HSL-7]